ncbi:MAG: hypothetical protein QQN63_00800 [Nitrosopumilus sp.]
MRLISNNPDVEVTICKTCAGYGELIEYINETQDDYDIEYVTCRTCEGSGRILVQTERKRIPFRSASNEL